MTQGSGRSDQRRWLIVDGYNLLYQWPAERGAPHDGAGRRRRLIRCLESAVGRLAERVTVVFDGGAGGSGGPPDVESTAVDVRYSAPNQSADHCIERLVYDAPDPAAIVVVTSDRGERDTVSAAGAATMDCARFVEQFRDEGDQVRGQLQRMAKRAAGPRLGDFFP